MKSTCGFCNRKTNYKHINIGYICPKCLGEYDVGQSNLALKVSSDLRTFKGYGDIEIGLTKLAGVIVVIDSTMKDDEWELISNPKEYVKQRIDEIFVN